MPALHSVLFHFTHQVTSGYSISLIRDPARGTSQLYLRVAWTSAFKQFFLLNFYGFTFPSIVCLNFSRIALSGGFFPWLRFAENLVEKLMEHVLSGRRSPHPKEKIKEQLLGCSKWKCLSLILIQAFADTFRWTQLPYGNAPLYRWLMMVEFEGRIFWRKNRKWRQETKTLN